MKMSKYYFELLKEEGIPNHYIDSDLGDNTMVVKPAKLFGEGLEVICRFRAYGSFVKRYGKYVQKGQNLDALVEITLKDDERGDPPINEEALVQLGIISAGEYKQIIEMGRRIATIIRDDLQAKKLELYDIKFEFGQSDGQVMLIDDISGGNMRVFKEGKQVDPLELARLVTEN